MTPVRAGALALVVAAAAGALANVAVGIPVWWAVLVALPVGAVVLAAGLLSGAYDADWESEPDPPAAGVCLHAGSLTDRLTQAAGDPYRFTSRVQPRLRRLALGALRRRPDTADLTDLGDPRARAVLGDDLHALLTARDARLPPPTTFAAMVRRLEEP